MRVLSCLAVVTCTTLATAQSLAPFTRPDVQMTQTPGVINDATGVLDVGFNQIDIASPRDFATASGGNVATPRLVYALFPDLDGNNDVVLRVSRSTDGGRNWQAPATAYTANSAVGEDLNTGDEGTHVFAHGDNVFVCFHTNAHNTGQAGQSLWVVGSNDQGTTWSAPLNVSTGWNRAVGDKDWDVDLTEGTTSALGLHLVWEADFEDPFNPGNANAAPDNNENLYVATVVIAGTPPSLSRITPEIALTANPMGGSDVNEPTIAASGSVVLVAYTNSLVPGSVAPGGRVTCSTISFDAGFTWSAPYVHSGMTPGTFTQAWAAPRRPWALIDGPYAFVIQEDSRADEDDAWMDRGDIDLTNQAVNWTTTGIRCNHTSTTPGSGDIDGIIAAAHDGVLAILYRDDSRNTPLNNSNEAYLVVDRAFGNEFIAGTQIGHTVTTSIATIYDLEVLGNMIAGVYEGCPTTNEEGGMVLSHDRGATIESFIFTTRGSCNAGTVDVDDVQVALSLNGDFNVIYADERLGSSNLDNVSWVSGGKWPRLSYDPALLRLTMDKIDPQQSVSALGFLMISSQTSPGTDLNAYVNAPGAGSGHFVGLGADFFFFLMWANAFPYLTPVDPAGAVVWNQIPNATAIVGIPIHVAGGTLDWADLGTDVFLSYTDTILQ